MVKNKEIIYQAFFNSNKNKLYYNQLKDITSLSYSSLQTVLKRLKENEEIVEEKTKSNTFYSLTNKCRAIEFTKITIDKINNLNIDAKIPIKDFIKLVPSEIFTIILFGSVVLNQEQKGSDIDLLVVLHKFDDDDLQKLYEEEIREKFERIKKEINTRSIYPLSLFITNKEEYLKKEDYVIQEAILKGFPIKNQLQLYENEI